MLVWKENTWKIMQNDIYMLTTAVMVENIATVKYRPSFASAKKPARSARRLRLPMKLVTIVADFAVGICRSPTKYVTKFIEIPTTQILSASSEPKDKTSY